MANASEALSRHLAQNLEAQRRARKLSQLQLAKLAGLPRSTVTLLESGTANPSLLTVHRVAEVLGCKMEELLAKPRARYLHLKDEEIPCHLRSRQGVCLRKLLPDALPHLDFDEVLLDPEATMIGAPHTRGTKEYMLCTQGSIEVTLEDERVRLKRGDVLAFPGSVQHSYRNLAKAPARFVSLVVLAPQF
jgi:transcriptional regulator with XRE-family HTH domain